MYKKIFLTLTLLSLIMPVFGHLCHDPFRPQNHLLLIPEKKIIKIEEEGEFRVYVENTFSSVLRNLKLIVTSPAFDIETKPDAIAKLSPGERSFYLVKLKLRKGFKPEEYPLKLSVAASEAELSPSVEKIDVIVAQRQDVTGSVEVIPSETEQKEIIQEKKRVVQEQKKEVSLTEVKPEQVIQPQREKIEEVPQEVGEVVVKVEKIPFWKKYYFYIVLILLLLGIVIWRKLK